MKSSIKVAEIINEAIKHETIAGYYRSLAQALNGLNPNVSLLINVKQFEGQERPPDIQNHHDNPPGKGEQTMFEVLVDVMREAGKAMPKHALVEAMKKRGEPIKLETLTSYLSRGKDKMFKNPKRGMWKLKEQTPVNNAETFGPSSPV